MRLRVVTRSGSVYILDLTVGTWERVAATARSGPVRTDGGPLGQISLHGPGWPLVIYGPPLDPAMDTRQITTSPVVSYEEIPVAEEPVEKINKKLKRKHAFRRAEGQESAGENPAQDESS